MMKLLTVIGARPQIIKAAAISRAVKEHFAEELEEKILHTGQHYDANMSQVFIDELGIPQPDYNLGVGSGKHGEQTAKMIAGIEEVLLSEHFDGIILYGDTNSTLAGAVAASKIHVPIFHIEAGLRSFNMAMPEEVNRMVCDQLSSILFAPTETGMENLRQDGYLKSKAKFKNGKSRLVYNSGDVMYDNSLYFASARQLCFYERWDEWKIAESLWHQQSSTWSLSSSHQSTCPKTIKLVYLQVRISKKTLVCTFSNENHLESTSVDFFSECMLA